MADETTETTTDTTTAVTPSAPSGVLDLRPPQESVRAELCRLGLSSPALTALPNRGATTSVACLRLSMIPVRPSL